MELLGLLPLPVAELVPVAAGGRAAPPEVAEPLPKGRGTVPFWGRTVVQPVGRATPEG